MNRKPLFDTIRRILGRGFRQSEVDRLDAAIDAVSAATSPSGELFQGRGVSERGLRLIRDFEGCARIRQEEDVARHARDVATALGNAQTTQAQFDALVSFHYNTGAIARSTLLRLHEAAKYGEAAAEFARWNRAGGRILKGLVRRRKAEAALYRSQ